MLVKMSPSVPLFEHVKMLVSSHSPCSFFQVVSPLRFHIKNSSEDLFFLAHVGGIPVVPSFLQKANMEYSRSLIYRFFTLDLEDHYPLFLK